eukprot:7201739-Prorocentrum_lima.AAC.1
MSVETGELPDAPMIPSSPTPPKDGELGMAQPVGITDDRTALKVETAAANSPSSVGKNSAA